MQKMMQDWWSKPILTKNNNIEKEFIINGQWVLVNAYFYKFWIKYTEFKKYNI